MSRRRRAVDARVYITEDDLIVRLDEGRPTDSKGEPVHGIRYLEGPLRFSVTRGGTYKLAKKVQVYPQEKVVHKTDADGNKIPNPNYGKRGDYGRRDWQEYLSEVVELEPSAQPSYEVDRDWWKRHAHTSVKI